MKPADANIRESVFSKVIFSLKRKSDMSITNIGAVYISIAARDNEEYFIERKYVTESENTPKNPAQNSKGRCLILTFNTPIPFIADKTRKESAATVNLKVTT
jgi:hypothetical protein